MKAAGHALITALRRACRSSAPAAHAESSFPSVRSAFTASAAALALAAALCGCSVKHGGVDNRSLVDLRMAAYRVASVENRSGYEGEVDLVREMTAAMEQALASRHLAGSDYGLHIRILRYLPGNAALAAVPIIGSAGMPFVSVECVVKDAEGRVVARVDSDQTIMVWTVFAVSAIGGWRKVIINAADHVADQLNRGRRVDGVTLQGV